MTPDEKLDRILELLEQIVKQTAPKTRTRKPAPLTPKYDAPIDEWLDWRDAERKKGRRVTLTKLAEWSRWGLGTFKKASMNRRKPKSR